MVCEGYAKAFQYLCDLSNLPGATCYTVSGQMGAGTGAGNHMWNIVSMPDGKNYLVDITNCDSGSVGYPDLLFLKGYTSCSSDYKSYNYNGVTYAYDSGTISTFSQADLTLSATAYGSVISFTLAVVSNGVRVAWDALPNAPRYNIYRKVGSGSWSWLAGTTGTSYTDTTASPGATYTYRMAVVSADGKTMLSPMGAEKSLTR